MKYICKISTLFITLISLSTFANATEYPVHAFYGDPSKNRVVGISVLDMRQISKTRTAATPYPVDRAGTTNKVYAITRGANSVDILDAATGDNIGTIPLDHKPRSGEAYNSTLGLQLIAGGDKPLSSLIDPETDTVVATAGTNTVTVPNGDYGGGNASGHPYWFTEHKFAVIDRANRKIQLYVVNENDGFGFDVQFIDEITTPTSVHHFVKRDRRTLSGRHKYLYYAVAEGSPSNGIPPKLLEIKVDNQSIKMQRSVDLSGFDPAIMGSHHADLHPDGVHIYQGSQEGHMFVINRKTMQVESVIETGRGSAHTRFVPARNLAVVTNHKDTFLTIIDTIDHTKIADVTVSPEQQNGAILQSHTTYVGAEDNNFYAFASDDGTFYELNLDSLTITRTVYTGGTPLQGVFVPQHDDDEN